jgi:hypothetical protein
MATLFNTKIKDTYQSLLKLEDNTILTTTTKNVTDGLGNASPLYMSTTRVGVGTNSPTGVLHVVSTEVMGGNNGGQIALSQSGANSAVVGIQGSGWNTFGIWGISRFTTTSVPDLRIFADGKVSASVSLLVGSITASTAKLTVRGDGSSSATTSLLVQNSSGTEAFKVTDDRTITTTGTLTNFTTTGVLANGLGLTASSMGGYTSTAIYKTGGGEGQIDIAHYNAFTSNGVTIREFFGTGQSLYTLATKFELRILGGFTSSNGNNSVGNTLWMEPIYNITAQTGTIVRGIYYNPTLTSLVNTTHTAIETVTGNVLLGTTSGNVGIGTSSPGSKLTVDGNISVINNNSIIGYVAANQGMYLTGGAGELRFINGSGAGWYYTWYQNNQIERMRLSTANNLLIGTTTDSGFKLDVNGTLRVVDKVRFQNEVAFYSTDGNAKFVIPAAAGYATQINYGSWGSASIKFIDVQTGGLLLGNTTSTVSLNAMLDLQSDSRGMYFNRGTIATMPNLVGSGGIPTYSIISPGSGYTNGYYTDVTATGNYFGEQQVTVTVTGGVVTSVGLWSYGTKVQVGEVFTVAAGALGAGGSGFSFTIASRINTNPGFNFYNTTTNALTYWNGTKYAVPVVSLLDRVNIGSSSPADRSAILQVTSNTQGFLPPKMTNAQRAAINTPAIGLLVYCTDTVEGIYVYKSTGWTFVA